jgi:hypothetical protein
MADIRLHTLRRYRTRNGYSRLDDSQSQQDTTATSPAPAPDSRLDLPMRGPLNTISSFRRVHERGRRRNQYGEGEPEEEATLLGEGDHDPGFSHSEEDHGHTGAERTPDAVSQVRAIECSIIIPSSDVTGMLR